MFKPKPFTTGAGAYWTESSRIGENEYKVIIRSGRVVTCDPKQSCIAEDNGKLYWVSNETLFNSIPTLKDKYGLPYAHGDY